MERDKKMENILFIGNSFTYYHDMPGLFREIAGSAGYPLRVDSVTRGGWTLVQLADRQDEYGARVEEALKSDVAYDVIILQDQSKTPAVDFRKFRTGALALSQKIAADQRQAQISLYATWGYAEGNEELAALGYSTEELCYRLLSSYEAVADDLYALVAYSGLAFLEAYRKTGISLYAKDLKHPSRAGSYLNAAVHFFTLFPDAALTDVTYYGDLPEKTAQELLRIAFLVTRYTGAFWNRGMRETYRAM